MALREQLMDAFFDYSYGTYSHVAFVRSVMAIEYFQFLLLHIVLSVYLQDY